MNRLADANKSSDPERMIVEFYKRKGYRRNPDRRRQKADGTRKYKKGCEIRIVVFNRRELALVRRLLQQVKMESGQPYGKGNQFVIPIYGHSSMLKFTEWLRVDKNRRNHGRSNGHHSTNLSMTTQARTSSRSTRKKANGEQLNGRVRRMRNGRMESRA